MKGIYCVAFLCGVLLIFNLPFLPAWYWLGLPVVGLLLGLFFKPLKLLFWLSLGILIAYGHALHYLSKKLPIDLSGTIWVLEGNVSDLPKHGNDGVYFTFHAQKIIEGQKTWKLPAQIALNWFNQDIKIQPDQFWRLKVKLKTPNGLMNPGGFDRERWFFTKKTMATGYVIDSIDNQLIKPHGKLISVNQFRADLSQQIRNIIDSKHVGILCALLLGDKRFINSEQKAIFSKAGIAHLLVISGLHITLIAGIGFLLAKIIFVFFPNINQLVNSKQLAGVIGLLFACCYALLAGFSLPTQRALIMLAMSLGCVFFRRENQCFSALCIAFVLILVITPVSVLSSGFWLSFIAVWSLLYCVVGRHDKKNSWLQLIKAQGFISLIMLPITAWLFGQVAWIAPVANLVAIPWFSFITVPIALLGLVTLILALPISEHLLQLAAISIEPILWINQQLLKLPYAHYPVQISSLSLVILSLCGACLLLFPAFPRSRWLGLPLLLLFIMPVKHELKNNGFKITILDVGQGLSVFVETTNHKLLYDTGPKLYSGAAVASFSLIPFLRFKKIEHIDYLVVSHGDSDHSGGFNVIDKNIEYDKLFSSDNKKFPSATPCVNGNHWQWDGVVFQFLHPNKGLPYLKNDSSCVLMITSEDKSVIIPGDIGVVVEKKLVNEYKNNLQANVLIAAHHGSKTSSSDWFIKAVQPDHVIYSTGFNNRFGMPHDIVVKRYTRNNIQQWNTADHGAITISLTNNELNISSYRQSAQKLWHR